MKERRRRRIPPGKAQEAVLGGEVEMRSFYARLPEPAKITCSRCGEERNDMGQEDGICLKCRWEERKAAREALA